MCEQSTKLYERTPLKTTSQQPILQQAVIIQNLLDFFAKRVEPFVTCLLARSIQNSRSIQKTAKSIHEPSRFIHLFKQQVKIQTLEEPFQQSLENVFY